MLRVLAISAFILPSARADDGDASRFGIPVGAKAPDFTLSDQHDTKQTLHSLMGPRGLVLVFFRSADW